MSQEVFLSQNFLNEKEGPLKKIDVSDEKILEVSDSS